MFTNLAIVAGGTTLYKHHGLHMGRKFPIASIASLPGTVSSRTIARCGESFLSDMMDETIKMLGEKWLIYGL